MTVSSLEDKNPTKPPLTDAPCFIEQQFPVAKLSMESYKERTAKQSQTLTGLGKWWGRKPLVLVRAALLGLLIPASGNPEKDRDIFLKLMTMDNESLWRRKDKAIPPARLVEELLRMPSSIKQRFLVGENSTNNFILRHFDRHESSERDALQRLVFDRMAYSEKIEYCVRPEQINGTTQQILEEINAHLGTRANSLSDLVRELGLRRFGHNPRVGDAFCGVGSIPFEAARLGCNAFASDLNPVAAMLSWAAMNIIGGGEDIVQQVESTRKKIYEAVDRQITGWGIEHNSLGWRADAYLYCVEVTDPESGWKVPLLPSFVIGKKTNTITRLSPDLTQKRFEIQILEGVSQAGMEQTEKNVTARDFRLVPPNGGTSTPIETLRRGLRNWEKEDIVPRAEDVFQERLYCIRWIETYIDDHGHTKTRKHYRAPTVEDFKREQQVLELLQERFDDWQEKGYIPRRPIEPGAETERLQRERGWTYWHHLFTPRQLLLVGLLNAEVSHYANSAVKMVGSMLSVGKCADWNSKLCRWNSNAANEKTEQTFYNQALNTLITYGSRTWLSLDTTWFANLSCAPIIGNVEVVACDARTVSQISDIWITDPPYAEAVNYEELSEYFLAWYEGRMREVMPSGYTDSKRALAVKGNDQKFRLSMVACYKRLAECMPNNGLQIVMFTHQDAAVWADLTLILWAAGLRVTAAWTIATETDTSFRAGNYVQGTVLLVLRKRTDTQAVFLDEINHLVDAEVRRQLDSMIALEDDSDPNFGDADYQLAAYAAALRVLTERPIEEIDPEREILRPRQPGEVGPVEQLIRRAVKIACDHLLPRGLAPDLWKQLGAMERFYLKGLEVESHGEYRSGVYQELARGFGAADYTDLLAATKANQTRLKSASEFAKKMLSGEGFAGSLVRQCLFAIFLTLKDENTQQGLNWLHAELPDYWASREKVIHILEYLSRLRYASPMVHWEKDASAAALLAGAVRNDHV